jgi:peptidoglycan/xylan/chitin deacetylase (PgdA/CDA1 family)
MKKKYNIFFICITVFFYFSTSVYAAGPHAVIFMYHRFGENKYPSTNVRVKQLEAHLDHLSKEKYAVLPLSKIMAAIKELSALPDRTVAITIDDAYLSVYEVAYPKFKALGWPFTVFVNTDPIDQRMRGYMSWDQLREIHANGATLANHCANHDSLIGRRPGETSHLWLERIRENIERAQTRLKKEIGTAPMLFSYPYGEYNREVADLVAKMGYSAFGQQSGAVGPLNDSRAFPRFPINERYAGMDEFRVKALTFPLPVKIYSPWDPVASNRRPRLEITLDSQVKYYQEMTCYVSGQGKVPVDWISSNKFSIQAPLPLKDGRNRYNCTVPSKERNRYYWFSQQWIVLPR